MSIRMFTLPVPCCSTIAPRCLLAALVGAATLLPAPVSAQEDAIDGAFSTQRFNPAPGPKNFLSTRGARTEGKMSWSAGALVNYSSKPFVIRSCVDASDCDSAGSMQDINVVENLVTADLMGSLTPIPRLQLGMRLPLTYVEGDGFDNSTNTANFENGIDSVGLGDIELEGKYRLHGQPEDTVVIGVAGFFRAPMGNITSEGNFIGDSTVSGGIRGIFDGQEGPVHFGLNLSGMFRGAGRVRTTDVGTQCRYNAAGGYDLSPLVEVIGEVYGSTNFTAANGANSMEFLAAGVITPLESAMSYRVGAGSGVIQGVGVPVYRVIAGVNYSVEGGDADGDGIGDDVDACPRAAEDRDGFEDSDGCPDPDNDGDTILDRDDKCPDNPEDPDQFEDLDGCPEADNDKDGIDDEHDRCPLEPETVNNYKDEDGCPDVPDTDSDGVPDSKDKCPKEPEDTDGFEDTDGCPDPDNDQDGIPDDADECVDEPETKNDFEDADGCPDEAPQ